MTISDQGLEDLISLCEVIGGRRPTPEEVRPIAVRLLELYRLITQPISDGPPAQAQIESEAA